LRLPLPLSPFESHDVPGTLEPTRFELASELAYDVESTGLRGEHERLFERGGGSVCISQFA